MRTERAQDIIEQHLEEMWNAGDTTNAADLCAADIVQHDPFTTSLTNLESYLTHLEDVRHAFPDLRITIHDTVVAGQKAVVRWTFEGTHSNAISGIAPTGRPVIFAGISMYRLEGGRIAEIWTSWDTIGYLRQLGAVPGLERPAV